MNEDTARDLLTPFKNAQSFGYQFTDRSVFCDPFKEINHKGQNAAVISLLDIAIECCQTENKRLDINDVHAKFQLINTCSIPLAGIETVRLIFRL